MARATRAIVTTKRVPGNREGEGGKGHGVGDEDGVQQRGQWQQQRGQWRQGWRVSNGNEGDGDGDGDCAHVGNGDDDEAGWRQKGQGQGWQGQL
jgi:hypothetical protein